ncbi:RagB/SusD family nutrient uptake outer membrane protein [Tellurirhabdus bombi]|uniref:RagB/SusD family nutrient uptake outer membrane protein n=1 Tax=Tellurirhabdus bombi TaxID=2907205 RepID=UPI001F23DFF2|nr:RagB/SusD family nutrient uptake outer membrane protein [Tellurirhabdus bombi]
MKKIITTLAILTGLCTTSCKDYLEEELVSTLTYQYYDTEQGVEDLLKACYETSRHKFGYEHGYALFNFGVDEFVQGDQLNFNYFNVYDNRLNASEGYFHDVWSANYEGINRCNIAIQRVPVVTPVRTLVTAAARNQRLGEAHFLRAYYYFMLVQQFGAIPLVTAPSEGVQLEFTRASVPDVYNQIIADLRFAVANLPATQGEFGRATRGAAQHILADVYLTRGSAVTDVRGQKSTDIDSAAFYADAVINSNVYALENDFGTLWDYRNIAAGNVTNAIAAAERSKEIIFSTQFNTNLTLAGRFGNQMHMYFLMSYDLNEPGLTRDIVNGRPFRRLRPSDYAMDIYDRKNDSRFYKSMKVSYLANNAASIPKWTATDAPSPNLVGQAKFALGDTALHVIVNSRETTLTERDLTRNRYKTYARYYRRANGTLVDGFVAAGGGKFPSLLKYIDPNRTTVAQQQGTRDGIIARLGETYLIAAEAYGRKGDYGKALTYINKLRERAAYKAGETKAPQFWQTEGGSRNDVSSTYEAVRVTEAKFNTNDPAEMYPASATSAAQRFIHFILNERTRELMGELHRWEDLARTETLVERTKLFNKEAVNIQPFHKLRPIPQAHLERIFTQGRPLTSTERQAQQNPGY